jgi:hypothetical protein
MSVGPQVPPNTQDHRTPHKPSPTIPQPIVALSRAGDVGSGQIVGGQSSSIGRIKPCQYGFERLAPYPGSNPTERAAVQNSHTGLAAVRHAARCSGVSKPILYEGAHWTRDTRWENLRRTGASEPRQSQRRHTPGIRAVSIVLLPLRKICSISSRCGRHSARATRGLCAPGWRSVRERRLEPNLTLGDPARPKGHWANIEITYEWPRRVAPSCRIVARLGSRAR